MDLERKLRPYLEEIQFKNETDLQQQLSDLLPPREVFMSTIFLMQDAPNIFELLPTKRLQVLKNVFGLLGIDEAKDKLAEKKRSIQTELKIKSDTQSYDKKLQQYLASRFSAYDEVSNLRLLEDVSGDEGGNGVLGLKDIKERVGIDGFDPEVLQEKIV